MVVLPARGGETSRPRCPKPIGESMSMIRSVMSSLSFVSSMRRSGSIEVSSSHFGVWW